MNFFPADISTNHEHPGLQALKFPWDEFSNCQRSMEDGRSDCWDVTLMSVELADNHTTTHQIDSYIKVEDFNTLSAMTHN
jgi:hypothetical protein